MVVNGQSKNRCFHFMGFVLSIMSFSTGMQQEFSFNYLNNILYCKGWIRTHNILYSLANILYTHLLTMVKNLSNVGIDCNSVICNMGSRLPYFS